MSIWGHVELIVAAVVFLAAIGLFSHYRLWPAVTSVRDLAELLNTKGGIILMLGAMSLIFFFTGMRWLYWSTMLIVHKELAADNALVLNGFNWVSGAAFMGAFGAMLNAMKGETTALTTPPPGTATTVTQTTTAATEVKSGGA
jgi:hypothetical protein